MIIMIIINLEARKRKERHVRGPFQRTIISVEHECYPDINSN